MPDIKLTTLDSGLRIVTDPVNSVESAALGVWIDTGSRNEDGKNHGAAHMVEHMLFKGTTSRTAKEIAASIENVGGSMNAYTSREVTSYHCHVMAEDVNLGIDVISDMVQNSTLPDDEVERERQVVLQEIGMTYDTPDDIIFDHFYETAYGNQPFGAPILGTVDSITNMKREALTDFIGQNYTPENTVVSISGKFDDNVIETIKNSFGNLPTAKKQKQKKPAYTSAEYREQKELEQAHIILGFKGMDRFHDNFYASQALSRILGGGMSSRLFQEVREKRGLAYSIFSFISGYSDAGLFGIYCGTSADDVPELMKVLNDQTCNAAATITQDELDKAKSQLKAGLIMARESMMRRADQQAKYAIYRNEKFDAQHLIEKINAITIKQIQQTANDIFKSEPVLCGLGPLQNLPAYEDIKKGYK